MSNTKIGLMLQGDIPGLTRTPTVPSIAMLESVARVLAHSMRYGAERAVASCIAQDFARVPRPRHSVQATKIIF